MKKTIWLYAILAGLLSSCGSIQSFTFDELIPAETSFPEQLSNVAVVNNTVTIPTPKHNLLTLGTLEGDGKEVAEMLANQLADSRYFNQVIICDSALQGNDVKAFYGYRSLTPQEVNQLAQDLGVDVLFCLDRIAIHTEKTQISYPQVTIPFETIGVQIMPTLSIYLPGREKPMRVMTLQDSLYCDIDPMLSDKFLVEEASYRVTDMIASRLVPHWSSTTRFYYDGGSSEMRDAVVAMQEQDWAAARQLWTSVYDKGKKGSLRMKAAFNNALACEMEGNLTDAVSWLDKAKALVKPNTEEARIMEYYEGLLQKRQVEIPQLNIQMNRFQNNF